jgi:hypothetical protein
MGLFVGFLSFMFILAWVFCVLWIMFNSYHDRAERKKPDDKKEFIVAFDGKTGLIKGCRRRMSSGDVPNTRTLFGGECIAEFEVVAKSTDEAMELAAKKYARHAALLGNLNPPVVDTQGRRPRARLYGVSPDAPADEPGPSSDGW